MVHFGWVIALGVVALLAGGAAGFFLARRYTRKYLEENPPVSEAMIRAMYSSMGRKPSEKQVRQTMNAMKQAQ